MFSIRLGRTNNKKSCLGYVLFAKYFINERMNHCGRKGIVVDIHDTI
jgi:hypothetical protein